MKRIKFLLVGISCLLSMLFSISVSAAESSDQNINNDGMVKVTDELISDMASNFIQNSYDMDLEVSDILPLYDSSDKIIGYSASYFKENIPFGYIIFNFNYDGYIEEYVVEENAISPFSQIAEELSEKNEISTFSNDTSGHLYHSIPLEYNFEFNTQDGAMVINNYGQVDTKEEYKEYAEEIESKIPSTQSSYYTNHDIFISPEFMPTSFSERKRIGTYISTPEKTIRDASGRYACSISALLNICRQSGLVYKNSIGEAYLVLWEEANTTTIDWDDGDWLGSNTIIDTANGMKSYMSKYMGRNINYSIDYSPTFNKIKSIVNTPLQSILSYGINVKEDGKIERSGHTITINGYDIATNGTQYLFIADGWNAYGRYLNWNGITFTDRAVTSFTGIPVYE